MHSLTFESHYALVALVSLARHPDGSVTQMREISAREGLPAPFLSKILLKLRHAGLVRSRHGRGGGYALARPASHISVRDVLAAFAEADPLAFDTTLPSVAGNPSLVDGLASLSRKLDNALAQTTIAELAGMAPAAAHTGKESVAAAV